jgi:hypothetical protein
MNKKSMVISGISIILLFISTFLYAGQSGYASWYGGEFHGRKTATGKSLIPINLPLHIKPCRLIQFLKLQTLIMANQQL